MCEFSPDDILCYFFSFTSCPWPLRFWENKCFPLLFYPSFCFVLLCSTLPPLFINMPISFSFFCLSIPLTLLSLHPDFLHTLFRPSLFGLLLSCECYLFPLLTFLVNNLGIYHVLWIWKNLTFSAALSASVWLLQYLLFFSPSASYVHPPPPRKKKMLAMSCSTLQFLCSILFPSFPLSKPSSPLFLSRAKEPLLNVWKEERENLAE